MSQTQSIKKTSLPSVQKYLDIQEIKEDCVILKDGSLRAVLLVSSINFALKSEEEQNALVFGYRNFLNTLESWPIQIIIQSRKLNIEGYIEDLKKREKEQTNELLRMQIAEYIEYIQELVEIGEIMTKGFFIVIPYNPMGDKSRGFRARLVELFSPIGAIRLSRKNFEKYKIKLFKRVNFIMSGLESIGLKSISLDTQSLIELLYNTYNPAVFSQEKLVEIDKLRVEEE